MLPHESPKDFEEIRLEVEEMTAEDDATPVPFQPVDIIPTTSAPLATVPDIQEAVALPTTNSRNSTLSLAAKTPLPTDGDPKRLSVTIPHPTDS